MILDAHQHFWRIGANECTWPTPDLTPIYRDFMPADLEPVAIAHGVSGSVLVQSQPSDVDTEWMLTLAEQTHFVRAVVGWVDFAADDAPARIAELAARPKLRGLRPMLQGLADDAWIAQSQVRPALEAMVAHGLRFDALVFTRHLPHLRRVAVDFPDLQIVIDHGAKPPIASGAFKDWEREISAIAQLPNVSCKLSGLLTEAGLRGSEALAPYVQHLVHAFGAERLMWGSDWPVVLLAGEYGAWLELARDLSRLRAVELDRVFASNARVFYHV